MPRQRRGGGRAQRSFSKRRGAGGRRLAETREASGAVGEGQSGGDRGSDKQRSSDACAERRPSPRAVSSRREEAAAPTASALAVSAHAAGTLLGAGHEEAACGEESAGGGGVSGWADACEGLLDPKEAAAEMRHLASVRRAFQLYEADALCDVARIERHLLKLSASERELLGPPSPEERVAAIRQAVAVNQNFIDLMLLAASSVCPPDSQEEQDADDSSADVYSPSVANAEWGSDEGEAASLDGKRQPEADSPRSSSPGDVTAVPGASMDAWQKTLHSAECCSRSPRESALKQQEERGGLAETGEGREEQSALQGTTRSFGEEPEEGFDALESADPEKLACNMSKVTLSVPWPLSLSFGCMGWGLERMSRESCAALAGEEHSETIRERMGRGRGSGKSRCVRAFVRSAGKIPSHKRRLRKGRRFSPAESAVSRFRTRPSSF